MTLELLSAVHVCGLGSFDGRTAAFNLPGPDLTAEEYKPLLEKLRLQRVVFVNTASSSGAFLSVLAGPGRTIVTATKTGGERNETELHWDWVPWSLDGWQQFIGSAFKGCKRCLTWHRNG